MAPAASRMPAPRGVRPCAPHARRGATPARAVARGSPPELPADEWPSAMHLASYADVQEFFRKPAKSPAVVKPRKQRNVAAFAIAGPPPSEWPSTISQDMYESVVLGIERRLKASIDPKRELRTLMTDLKYTAGKDDAVSNVMHAFDFVTGVVVVEDARVVGVLSKKDITNENMHRTVGEVMSSPAITIEESKTVADAAGLMLKHDIHRVPVVARGSSGRCVGILTRTDIFHALGY